MSCSILSLTLTILYIRWYINVSDLHDIHILSLFMEYWLNSAIWVRHRWSRDLDVTSLSGTTLNQYIQLKWTLTVLGKVLTWVNLLFLSYHNSVCFLKFLFYLIINKLIIIFFCFRYIIFFFLHSYFCYASFICSKHSTTFYFQENWPCLCSA